MLGHRLQRWPNIKSTLYQSVMFAEHVVFCRAGRQLPVDTASCYPGKLTSDRPVSLYLPNAEFVQ